MDNFRTIPAVDVLTVELRQLAKMGWARIHPDSLPALFNLRAVRQEVRGEAVFDQILALEHSLRKAVALLGLGERADAARALLGLDPATRSWTRPRRREAAKDILLDPAWDLQTFRRRYEQTLLSDVAYAIYKLESHVRLGFPLDQDEVEALSAAPRRRERRTAAAGPEVRLISSHEEVKATLFQIIEEANDCLVTTGSRSRDPDYLTCLEAKLARNQHLVHYRVLFGPPRWQVFKDHLLRLIKIRDPGARPGGNKTIFIGLFDDFGREPENFLCANERHAFIRLPSLAGIQKYDTGIELRAQTHAGSYIRLAQELYSASRRLESEGDLLALPVMEPDRVNAGT